jgi:surface carbohydrate biosynthesis protein (TIGR04326 family)
MRKRVRTAVHDRGTDRWILLWDSELTPPPSSATVYLWNGHGSSTAGESLLDYCEANAVRLRAKYTAWVHDAGNAIVGGKRLIDLLARDDGLSFWWMSLLVERSSVKSPATNDVIRLFAFEELMRQRRAIGVKVVSGNRNLIEAVESLCLGTGVTFACEARADAPHQPSKKRIVAALPQPFKGCVTLIRRVASHWYLKRPGRVKWFEGQEALFICSYFDNVDGAAAVTGRFRSRYWNGLADLATEMGVSLNWLHIFHADQAVPNPRVGVSFVRAFNESRHREGVHAFTDGYLSVRIVFRVIRAWVRLLLLSWRLEGLVEAFKPSASHVLLWPLLRNDWYSSVRGSAAVDGLLWIELFDAALRDMPRQRRGLYLYENQAWERALVFSWRKHGHGQLIAVPHSTRSFWDMRFHHDRRTLDDIEATALPLPDVIAVNGAAARAAFIEANYPGQMLVDAEALRFEHLNQQRSAHAPKATGLPVKILLLGDYTHERTARLLKVVAGSLQLMAVAPTLVMKPHPNCAVDPDEHEVLDLTILSEPLGSIIQDFDIAVCSNGTSAAVDAFEAGLTVAVLLETSELNISPLRGRRCAELAFFSTSAELALFVNKSLGRPIVRTRRDAQFHLDPSLPRWLGILSDT